MPAQDRGWGDQSMATQCSGQPLDEGGEHGPVRPVHEWSWGATEHRDFMPQHEELNVLGGGCARRQQDQPITCWKIRYSSRSDTPEIMPGRWR